MFSRMQQSGHEQIAFFSDPETGLKGIVAIHDTTLGPALGGLRMWKFRSEAEAIEDVLRLSQGMTYKASIAGLNLGGGKGVIIGDSRTEKSEGLFRSFGRFVQGLGGRYITAEDVGTTVGDMETIRLETNWVAGLRSGGGGGDPSPFTAYGVYHGMKAACNRVFGNDSLEGRKIAVQGAGNVASFLVDHLAKEGADIVITDIYDERVNAIIKEHPGVTAVEPDDIYDVECDVFSPTALGGSVNDTTIDRFKTRIVAGAANNQLKEEMRHAQGLKERDILYVPDYVINAGGLINVYVELDGYSEPRALGMTENIYNIVDAILSQAEEQNILTVVASNRLAEERIATVGRIGQRYVSDDVRQRDRKGIR